MDLRGNFKKHVFENGLAQIVIALLIFSLIYVSFGLTPSHYSEGLRFLGIDSPPLFGEARSVRSDEWLALTPMFQSAVLGNFSNINQFSPYNESFKSFWAIPIEDWSLIFKPQLWSFWLVSPDLAFSIYFVILKIAFILGYTILLHRIGANLSIAFIGSLCLLFSHFVQVWWTSNAPTFAFAPWLAIVYLSHIRFRIKLPLLIWVGCVWIFSLVYPPFIIGGFFAIFIIIYCFRSDMFTVKNFSCGLIAGAIVLAISFLYYSDIIQIMRATEYPGQRNVSGGGVEASKIIAHLFPFFTITDFQPLLRNSNECEIAVVATLVPLSILIFGNYNDLLILAKKHAFENAIIGIALFLMFIWMTLPVSNEIGKFLLFAYVPPNRMLWGFGLLLNLYLIFIFSKISFEISFRRIMIFILLSIIIFLVSKIGHTLMWSSTDKSYQDALLSSRFDLVPILIFSVMYALFKICNISRIYSRQFILASVFLSGFVTFGTFNPVQRADVIFSEKESYFISALFEKSNRADDGIIVIEGHYGALFSGIGLKAINHVLMQPQEDFFRGFFPDIPEDEFRIIFNRYAHIIPQNVDVPYVLQDDVIIVPIRTFGSDESSYEEVR